MTSKNLFGGALWLAAIVAGVAAATNSGLFLLLAVGAVALVVAGVVVMVMPGGRQKPAATPPNGQSARAQGVGSSVGPSAARTEREAEERLMANVTPEELLDMHKDRTELEANRLVAPYVGRWIRVSGTVFNVSGGDSRIYVSLDVPRHDTKVTSLHFEGAQMRRVEVLKKGEEIVAVGQLEEVSRMVVRLVHCELESPTLV